MRKSRLLATILSAAIAFCMIPETVTHADTNVINITVNMGFMRNVMESDQGAVWIKGSIEPTNPYLTTDDMDANISISPREDAGIGECHSLILNWTPNHRKYLDVWYYLEDNDIYYEEADLEIYLNGTRIPYR
ncbi:MAG: hypothetical protein K6A37_02575 [Saccharofermentans sp.]|nr:hypothetical protein [Saccharofermentans sp.]